MDVIFSVAIIILLAVCLIIFMKWSYILIFASGRPFLWILIMGVFNFTYFFIGSKWDDHSDTIWWSSFLAFVISLPRIQKELRSTKSVGFFEVFQEVSEIKNCRLKQSLGLLSWAIGGGLGWLSFFKTS